MISLEIPTCQTSRAAFCTVESVLPQTFLNHAFRSYLIAQTLCKQFGVVPDLQVLFQSAIFHHWGLFHFRRPNTCFEIESADFGRRFIIESGGSEKSAENVWETIALHMSPEIAFRRSLETSMFARAIQMELFAADRDAFSPNAWSELFARYPRAAFKRYLLLALAKVAEIRAETASGTYLAEVGERLVPGFVSPKFCDRVSQARFEE